MRDSDGSTVLGRFQARPLFAVSRKPHVGSLNLFSCEALLDVQVQADERKDSGDGLGLLVGVLGGKRIDNMLVDKRRTGVGQRIERELVEKVLVGRHTGEFYNPR